MQNSQNEGKSQIPASALLGESRLKVEVELYSAIFTRLHVGSVSELVHLVQDIGIPSNFAFRMKASPLRERHRNMQLFPSHDLFPCQ